MSITKEQLIEFEEDIAQRFNDKQILAPVHLYSGNEDQMIQVFNENKIGPDDWVLCSWRSHYQCLLKGVPPELLRQRILEGKSISLCFPEYKVFSSAIVTGVLPIATGIGLSIKGKGGKGRVFCFVGDMTSETGLMWESLKFCIAHDLPVKFVVEDNGKSVCTDTRKTWNIETLTFEYELPPSARKFVIYYKYATKWPHAGSGKRIEF
jgi:TPP-dependent pyruvate/acetoin dehydrogenase alpha subunit